jgi:hypothetical protein
LKEQRRHVELQAELNKLRVIQMLQQNLELAHA